MRVLILICEALALPLMWFTIFAVLTVIDAAMR